MPDSIDDFLAGYSPAVQEISRKLREMVRQAMPQANEILYVSQNHIGYSLTQSSAERIVYICPMKDYVRLGFMRGTQIPDPNHLLVGEGKWLRHVKVRTLEQAGQPALERLVEESWMDADMNMRKKK